MSVDKHRIDATFDRLRRFAERVPVEVSVRKSLLRRLREVILESKSEIRDVVFADFQKSATEVELTEIATVLFELKTALNGLDRWAALQKVGAPFPLWSTKSHLSLAPVISAVAAGNRVVLKPSERTPETSALLKRLVDRSLGSEWCVVIEGGPDVGANLLSKPFDHFFFTGSPDVGRKIMEAAAQHLSSITLELGGKSPAIVDPTADVDLAAEKIVVGKFLNAGQTCIAPDYVVAHSSRFEAVVEALERAVAGIHASHQDTFTGLVDERHAERLAGIWEDARESGAVLNNAEALDLATVGIITNVSPGSRLMNEEIFGPLLPVVRYETIDDILELVTRTGPPLTSYLFTRSEPFAVEVERRLPTGSVCRDETLLHFAHPDLPFGGTGRSGMGRTHGRFGFRAFSNEVSVLRSKRGWSVLPLLFPVRGSRERRFRRWLFNWLEH